MDSASCWFQIPSGKIRVKMSDVKRLVLIAQQAEKFLETWHNVQLENELQLCCRTLNGQLVCSASLCSQAYVFAKCAVSTYCLFCLLDRIVPFVSIISRNPKRHPGFSLHFFVLCYAGASQVESLLCSSGLRCLAKKKRSKKTTNKRKCSAKASDPRTTKIPKTVVSAPNLADVSAQVNKPFSTTVR
jgi:hypothetical protein